MIIIAEQLSLAKSITTPPPNQVIATSPDFITQKTADVVLF